MASRELMAPPGVGAMYGTLLPAWVLPRAKDLFFEVLDFLPLPASGNLTRTFSVDADADWIMCSLQAIVTDPADPTVIQAPAPILVTITDSGSGRGAQNTAGHIETIYGTGQRPGFLPMGKVIPRASVVSVALQNLAATPWHVRLTHTGIKVFQIPERPPRG